MCIIRCSQAFATKQLWASDDFVRYHDTRWCKPEHRDNEQFAMLVLEGMQAGISWDIILRKEDSFRRAFDSFDPEKVASYDEARVNALMQDASIVRNRRKISAAVSNAQAFLRVQEEYGSFDCYIWGFTDGQVIDHHLLDGEDMPSSNGLSELISKDLKRRGFSFVGPVIVYSYLQSIGIVNDHWEHCSFR